MCLILVSTFLGGSNAQALICISAFKAIYSAVEKAVDTRPVVEAHAALESLRKNRLATQSKLNAAHEIVYNLSQRLIPVESRPPAISFFEPNISTLPTELGIKTIRRHFESGIEATNPAMLQKLDQLLLRRANEQKATKEELLLGLVVTEREIEVAVRNGTASPAEIARARTLMEAATEAAKSAWTSKEREAFWIENERQSRELIAEFTELFRKNSEVFDPIYWQVTRISFVTTAEREAHLREAQIPISELQAQIRQIDRELKAAEAKIKAAVYELGSNRLRLLGGASTGAGLVGIILREKRDNEEESRQSLQRDLKRDRGERP